MDWKLFTDVATLVITVGGVYLASRRDLLARITKAENDIANLRGILKGAGIAD